MHGNHQNRQNAPKAVTLPYVEKVHAEDAAGIETPPVTSVAEEPKPPEKKNTLGIVTGCSSLLVREKPNKDADIMTVLPAGTELMVDRENSTNGFYKVCNAAGIEGFCMKQYVELKA